MATILSTTAYDNGLARQLADICTLTTHQYDNTWPCQDGQIKWLPTGYRQVAAFTAAEVEADQAVSHIVAARPELEALVHQVRQKAASDAGEAAAALEQLRPQLEAALNDPATINALTAASQTVYIGFALEPDPLSPHKATNNVIALRGSESDYEWKEDLDVQQVPAPLDKFGLLNLGSSVHAGFMLVYGLIFDQIKDAVNKFEDKNLPLYVTGHSLGGALATLASLSAATVLQVPSVTMYNFASPRVGNEPFADSFDSHVANAYRLVNLADIVPAVPSPMLGLITVYKHVGEEWSFLNQTGDGGNNHQLDKAYIPALSATPQVETNAPRSYPNSGIPCGQ